jgi:beta-galactosidase GanA
VRGERVVIYSGEFHPFRLPVPDLWLDVFQKIKALGYNGVSFYINWALLEGQQGTYRASGIFALEPFFEAASEAGIYLLARPGPYINAEVSGGGFPGWLDRVDAPYQFRTNNTNYINATSLYAQSVGEAIAKGQITNGGPIILAQPENEYSAYTPSAIFPNDVYFGEVIDQLRNAGIVVPLISNDASPKGLFAPGNPNYTVHVNIYGYDG